MEAKELRIGNLVYDCVKSEKLECYQIRSIESINIFVNHQMGVTFNRGGENIFENIKPIPLTSDLLLKFGFKDNKGKDESFSYILNDFSIKPSVFRTNHLAVLYYANIEICYIDTVHHLQNIYFAIEGSELQYNI